MPLPDGRNNLDLPVLERETNGDASESAFIKFTHPITPIKELRAQNPKIAQGMNLGIITFLLILDTNF